MEDSHLITYFLCYHPRALTSPTQSYLHITISYPIQHDRETTIQIPLQHDIEGALPPSMQRNIEVTLTNNNIPNERAVTITQRFCQFYRAVIITSRDDGNTGFKMRLNITNNKLVINGTTDGGKEFNEVQTVNMPHVNEENEVCSICLQSLTENGNIHTTICNHMFHNICINQWIQINMSCPICRQSPR